MQLLSCPGSLLPSVCLLKSPQVDKICFTAILAHCVSRLRLKVLTRVESLSVQPGKEMAQTERSGRWRIEDEVLASAGAAVHVMDSYGCTRRRKTALAGMGGCWKADWAIREWWVPSAPSCWGAISPKHQVWANLSTPTPPTQLSGGEEERDDQRRSVTTSCSTQAISHFIIRVILEFFYVVCFFERSCCV